MGINILHWGKNKSKKVVQQSCEYHEINADIGKSARRPLRKNPKLIGSRSKCWLIPRDSTQETAQKAWARSPTMHQQERMSSSGTHEQVPFFCLQSPWNRYTHLPKWGPSMRNELEPTQFAPEVDHPIAQARGRPSRVKHIPTFTCTIITSSHALVSAIFQHQKAHTHM